jgi:hypothetical protein
MKRIQCMLDDSTARLFYEKIYADPNALTLDRSQLTSDVYYQAVVPPSIFMSCPVI